MEEEKGGAPDHLENSLVDERFEILEHLGSGGVGTVYRARDITLRREVAVKLLGQASLKSAAQVQRLQREAKALARLDHINILKVLDFGVSEKLGPYIVSELIVGESLEHKIDTEGALDKGTAFSIAIQICDGISHAHKHKTLHRDLKPSNILLVDQEGSPLVKVIDLGLATHLAGDQRLTKTGAAIGTPYYMSPEQIHSKELDGRCDIYSFGCLLFAMLTGNPPFKDGEALEIYAQHTSKEAPLLSEACEKQFPPVLEEIVARCLKKAPGERFQTMDDLRKQLIQALAEYEDKPSDRRFASPEPLSHAESLVLDRTTGRKHNSLQLPLIASILAIPLVVLACIMAYKSISSQAKLPTVKMNETDLMAGPNKSVEKELEFNFNIKGPDLSGHYGAYAGKVGGNDDESLRLLGQRKELKHITQLNLKNTDLTGEGLKYVAGAPLIHLSMFNTSLNDLGAENIARFRQLETMNLIRCDSLTNEGLKHISRLPKLRVLWVGSKNIDRETFAIVAKLRELGYLGFCVEKNKLPYGFADELAKSNIRQLNFYKCEQLTPEDLLSLSKISSLKEVAFEYMTLHRETCRALTRLRIKQFTFTSCAFGGGALRELGAKKNLRLQLYTGQVPLDDLRYLVSQRGFTVEATDRLGRPVNIFKTNQKDIPNQVPVEDHGFSIERYVLNEDLQQID